MGVDPGRAEAMIAGAYSIDPETPVPPDLQAAVRDAQCQREFENCSSAAAALEDQEDLSAAIHIVAGFLSRYPGHSQAESLQKRLVEVQDEQKRRAQRANDLEELRKIEDQAGTLQQRSNLLDLLDRTVQIAGRNAQHQDVTIVAHELRNILASMAEIRHLLTQNRLSDAEGLCAESIRRFPRYRNFAELQLEIQARQREEAVEYLRQVERKLTEEPDFRKHAAILEEAARAHPDETYYVDELELVRNREALLDREIARARKLEQSGLYDDALREWEALRSLYPWFASLNAEIDRVFQLAEEKKNEIVSAWIARIKDAIKAAQYDSASQILENALADLPDEPRLLAFRGELQELRQKQAAANDSFTSARSLLEAGDLSGALARFDAALRLTPEDAEMRNSIARVLLAKAQAQVGNTWEEAERLVAKIIEIQPAYTIPSELRNDIRRKKTASELARVLHEIDRETANGTGGGSASDRVGPAVLPRSTCYRPASPGCGRRNSEDRS